MSNPGDPQRSQQDRGYYGAGWQQPAPGPQSSQQQQGPPQPYGGGQYGAPQSGAPQSGPFAGQQPGPGPFAGPPYGGPSGAPQRRPRAEADPRRAFAPGASVTNTAGALIAVVSLVLVEFVSGLIGLLGTSLVVHPFSSYGAGNSLVGGFVRGVFASPFPFYAGAFLALAFLTPIARRSPLPTVLLRAVLAGAAGTVALALVGVFTGSFGAVRFGGARLVIDVLTTPLQNGIPFTVMLLATSTAAWLWLGRPRGGRRGAGAPGTPGTVRPADAVPPATVQTAPVQQQPQRYSQQQDPRGQQQQYPQTQHPQGQQQPPAPPYGGQQPPANPWGGPAPR
ncbi:hypothetical protein EDF64_10138 [Curtobacterium flaccumfaciens]|uniref:Uncharacterized protein n=1 Tax=Curtobacterium flaccumfaciens TaxID=2035 RepID=A0A4V3BLC9_9MICO|nr:hypothetical protein [Curtobacterium flaccumfaciens]TDN46182.1 hypothetical protein EDF64_10138 [Curtobacterium flaccumfaciens]